MTDLSNVSNVLYCTRQVSYRNPQEDELNIFEGMQDKQRSLLRKMIIDIVLATDMSRHLGKENSAKYVTEIIVLFLRGRFP